MDQCPWDALRPATLHFCEAHLCGWIVAPAETWSNLAYFAVGAFLLLPRRPNAGSQQTPSDRAIGTAALLVGAFSFLFHASHTWIFETFDLTSMVVLSAWMLVDVAGRLRWIPERKAVRRALYATILAAGFGLTYLLEGFPRVMVFGTTLVAVLAAELLFIARSKRLGKGPDLRGLYQSLALFLVSYAVWLADYHRWACSPDVHYLSGHAVWHVGTAACFLTLARYYRQFYSKGR